MDSTTHALNRFADVWWAWLLEAGWQAGLVGIAVLGIVIVGRRLPSPLRHGLILIAVLKFIVPPDLPAPTGVFSRVTRTEAHAVVAASNVPPAIPLAWHEEAAATAGQTPADPARAHKAEATTVVAARPPMAQLVLTPDSPLLSARAWFLLASLAGTLLTGAWILRQLALLRRIERESEPAAGPLAERFARICEEIGLRTAPKLLISQRDIAPNAYGIVRRRVLVPTAVTAMTDREIDCVLAHEAIHHRRGDLIVNAGLWAVQALWWFHPVAWLIGRSLRRVREECCDDLLLAREITSDEEYCDTLLRTAAFCAAARQGAMAAGIGRHPLGRRFARILDGTLPRAPRLSAAGFLTVALVSGVVLPGVRPEEATSSSASQEELVLRGRVLDDAGRPVRARLLVTGSTIDRFRLESWRQAGRADADGGFEIKVDMRTLQAPPTICALAEGYGIAWYRPEKPVSEDGIALTLPPDIPFEGRVIDLEGRPLAGVSIRPIRVFASTDGKLDTWLDHVKAGDAIPWKHLRPRTDLIAGMGTCEAATTDGEGRFVLHGLGVDRVVRAVLEGPEVQTALVDLVARKMKAFQAPDFIRRLRTHHGIPAELFAAPTRPVIGRVTDAVTGKPVSGITIAPLASEATATEQVKAVTGADGRYRMTGLPMTGRFYVRSALDLERRYLPADARLPEREGTEPIVQDLKLHRGVLVRGTVKEKDTGKPVREATVLYTPMGDNPNQRNRITSTDGWGRTQHDGSFKVLALPGAGVIGIIARGGYLSMNQQEGGEKLASMQTSVGFSPDNTTAVRAVSFEKATESFECNFELLRGVSLEVRVVDEAGKPLKGAILYGRTGVARWDKKPLEGETATLETLNPDRPRPVLAAHRERGLVGRLVLDHPGGPAIVMTAGGRVVGSFVDVDGLPRAGKRLALSSSGPDGFRAYQRAVPWTLKTDEKGRFDIPCLDPLFTYRLSTSAQEMAISENGMRSASFTGPTEIFKDVKVKANETQDVGALKGREL